MVQSLKTIIVILTFTTLNPVKGQSFENYYYKVYQKVDYVDSLIDFRNEYGNRKKVPTEFELQTLIAISHYPELKNIRLKFKIKKKNVFPISARPGFNPINFFRSRKNRQYLIFMEEGTGYVLDRTFNGQVGIIGHELAHIQYYKSISSWRLIKEGIKYTKHSAFRIKFEEDTDKRAIEYGFGWQFLEFPIYINPVEIKEYMRQKGYPLEMED
ncbi:hypothetical protein [Flexithrix dorotheae]|uniref:hypothetical protein n=1 Tax=Flexithrix dorotheae TaxID=70993 RepID=UPI00035F9720|nr:hypothetical protein [Flexithrix dorotheae]